MREVVSVHLGQAGVQIGNACWELFCLEHGIGPTGETVRLEEGSNRNSSSSSSGGGGGSSSDNVDSWNTFFAETQHASEVKQARAIFFDLDSTTIDEVKTGSYWRLFHPDNLIGGKEDAADNFCRGAYTLGKEYVDQLVERIRVLVEQCDNLEGVMLYGALAGATGSGTGSLLAQRLAIDFLSKRSLVTLQVMDSQVFHSTVGPYNMLQALSAYDHVASIAHSSVPLLFDNTALASICSNRFGMEQVTYSNMNRLVAQVVSSITAPLRFTGSQHYNFSTLSRYCHPDFYMLASLAPLQEARYNSDSSPSTFDIAEDSFHPDTSLLSYTGNVTYLSSLMLYRGDVTASEAGQASYSARNKHTFLEWAPHGSICTTGRTIVPSVLAHSVGDCLRSVCHLSCHTGFHEQLVAVTLKFDQMYAKRAFIHWFVGEGLEHDYFDEVRERAAVLNRAYETVPTRSELDDASQSDLPDDASIEFDDC